MRFIVYFRYPPYGYIPQNQYHQPPVRTSYYFPPSDPRFRAYQQQQQQYYPIMQQPQPPAVYQSQYVQPTAFPSTQPVQPIAFSLSPPPNYVYQQPSQPFPASNAIMQRKSKKSRLQHRAKKYDSNYVQRPEESLKSNDKMHDRDLLSGRKKLSERKNEQPPPGMSLPHDDDDKELPETYSAREIDPKGLELPDYVFHGYEPPVKNTSPEYVRFLFGPMPMN